MDHRPGRTHPPPGRPQKAVLDLGAATTAPGCALACTSQVLWEWRLAGLSDPAEVIVSELTTNGALASGSSPHHGPVTPGCPITCLLTVLSRNTVLTELTRLFPQFRGGARVGRAFLDLGAVLTAPGCARAWTREILREWGVAELVASELVTNSVNACAGLDRAAIRLVLTHDQGELAVLVRDDHSAAPVAVQPDAERAPGHSSC